MTMKHIMDLALSAGSIDLPIETDMELALKQLQQKPPVAEEPAEEEEEPVEEEEPAEEPEEEEEETEEEEPEEEEEEDEEEQDDDEEEEVDDDDETEEEPEETEEAQDTVVKGGPTKKVAVQPNGKMLQCSRKDDDEEEVCEECGEYPCVCDEDNIEASLDPTDYGLPPGSLILGGPGSGNFGHSGIPGQVGGSMAADTGGNMSGGGGEKRASSGGSKANKFDWGGKGYYSVRLGFHDERRGEKHFDSEYACGFKGSKVGKGYFTITGEMGYRGNKQGYEDGVRGDLVNDLKPGSTLTITASRWNRAGKNRAGDIPIKITSVDTSTKGEIRVNYEEQHAPKAKPTSNPDHTPATTYRGAVEAAKKLGYDGSLKSIKAIRNMDVLKDWSKLADKEANKKSTSPGVKSIMEKVGKEASAQLRRLQKEAGDTPGKKVSIEKAEAKAVKEKYKGATVVKAPSGKVPKSEKELVKMHGLDETGGGNDSGDSRDWDSPSFTSYALVESPTGNQEINIYDNGSWKIYDYDKSETKPMKEGYGIATLHNYLSGVKSSGEGTGGIEASLGLPDGSLFLSEGEGVADLPIGLFSQEDADLAASLGIPPDLVLGEGYNPYRDEKGRFTSGEGSDGGGAKEASGKGVSESAAKDNAKAKSAALQAKSPAEKAKVDALAAKSKKAGGNKGDSASDVDQRAQDFADGKPEAMEVHAAETKADNEVAKSPLVADAERRAAEASNKKPPIPQGAYRAGAHMRRKFGGLT